MRRQWATRCLRQISDVSINILGATLIEFGTHEQKLAHVPNILSGRELWLQFLSEPSGGSDLAGLLTTATRDGDSYVVNGQKTWSTSAHSVRFRALPGPNTLGRSEAQRHIGPDHRPEVSRSRDPAHQTDRRRIRVLRRVLHRHDRPGCESRGRGERGMASGPRTARDRARLGRAGRSEHWYRGIRCPIWSPWRRSATWPAIWESVGRLSGSTSPLRHRSWSPLACRPPSPMESSPKAMGACSSSVTTSSPSDGTETVARIAGARRRHMGAGCNGEGEVGPSVSQFPEPLDRRWY